MIYLDNAATSWPKPPEVLKAMTEALERAGGNPGRSGHRLSIAAARIIYDTREETARFFGISDPLRAIFTGNATYAINLALKEEMATRLKTMIKQNPALYSFVQRLRSRVQGTSEPDEKIED